MAGAMTYALVDTGTIRPTMKVLIVEDEIKTSEHLKQELSEAGFVVDLSWKVTTWR